MYVCECIFFPFLLDVKFVGCTSRGRTGGTHRIFHPPPSCGACLNFSRERDSAIYFPRRPCEVEILCIIIIIIIINGTLARSLEPVVTECKEHTIHTQTQIVASRKPKEIKHTHEGEANFTT